MNFAEYVTNRHIYATGEVNYNGVDITVKDLATIFEVKLTTVLTRVNRDRMTLKQALTTPRKFTTNGKTATAKAIKVRLYAMDYTIGQVATVYGVAPSTLRARVRRGMNIHAALQK